MKHFLGAICLILISSLGMADLPPPFSIDRSQVVTLDSTLLERRYDLFIQLPESFDENATRRYPFIFINDGNAWFPLATGVVRQLVRSNNIGEVIIVGISYSDEVSWQISRTRDYTPTYAPNETNYHSKEAREHSGGADAYLKFITTEVFPFLGKHYRADLNRKIYAGHSFGGLFGGYVLKKAPSAFDYYILSDPSFWYDKGSIFKIEQNKEDDFQEQVSVLIVSANPDPSKEVSGPLKMKENALDFGEALRSNTKIDIEISNLIFDGETHQTLFPIALSRGLRDYLGTKK
ncbi:alpha/beta hydrolase-fold protein [Aurantivibrio plasticivorans]